MLHYRANLSQIIVAFVIQGILSVIFSVWAFKIVLDLDVSDSGNMRAAFRKMFFSVRASLSYPEEVWITRPELHILRKKLLC